MDRRTVIAFNRAYSTEPTEQERQLVNDLLTVWGKLEPTAAKHPAMYRQGILFGMALQKAIAAGEVELLPVKRKRNGTATEQPEPGQG